MFEKNIEKKVINEEEVKEMKYILIEGKIISKKGYGDYEKSESYHIINLEGKKFFEYDNIYIGNCLCQKIYISDILSNQEKEKEKLFEYKIEIIMKNLYPKDIKESILESICLIINFELSKESYNKHEGFPNFVPALGYKTYYGETDKLFTIECMNFTGEIEKIEMISQQNLSKVSISKTSYELILMKRYMEAIKYKNPIAKFVTLFGFFELIYHSKKFKEILKNNYNENKKLYRNMSLHYKGEMKDLAMLDTLYFYEIKEKRNAINAGEVTLITTKDIKKIREKRNILFHETNLDNIHKVLYDLLLPIVFSIIETSMKNPEILCFNKY